MATKIVHENKSGIKEKLKNIYEFGIGLIYPRRCPVCDDIVKYEDGLICVSCKDVFQFTKEPVCMRCGKEVGREEKEFCEDCQKRIHYYSRNFACFSYRSMSQSIYRFKYGKRQEYATYYAQQIAVRLGEVIREIQPDALIPVPLHRSRFYTRGYNQAEVLAMEIGKLISVPVLTDYVVRVKKTTPQKELSRQNRQNNLKKAFKIKRNDVKLNTIIVIDDIYTTGSTIDMVSKVCLDAGVERVYSICLAIGKGL